MEFNESARIELIQNEDYEVELEYNPYFVIVHLKLCNRISKSVVKRMQSWLDRFEHFVRVTGYDGIYTASFIDDKKPEKLAYLVGFELIGTHDNLKVFKYASSRSDRSGRSSSDGRGSDSISQS